MPHAQKPVRACFCYPHSFAQLKQMAHENAWRTLGDISRSVGCGGGCGLCRPYLARMLETGETAFEIMSPKEAHEVLSRLS